MISPEKLSAARTGLAVGPPLERAFLRATGKDARDYLHRMSTQDVLRLAPGQAAYAAFLNAKGHLLGEGTVLALADALVIALDPAALEPARAHLEKFVIMDDALLPRTDVAAVTAALATLPTKGYENILDQDGIWLFRKRLGSQQ